MACACVANIPRNSFGSSMSRHKLLISTSTRWEAGRAENRNEHKLIAFQETMAMRGGEGNRTAETSKVINFIGVAVLFREKQQ